MPPRIYIAAPLFNEAERSFNLTVDATVRALGVHTYLPQRDGGVGADLVAQGQDPAQVRARLFELDVAAVRDCDALVMVLDGRVPDEGACVELGLAYAWNTPTFGLQTDIRRFGDQYNNLMIDQALRTTAHTLDELAALLHEHLLGLDAER